MATVMAVSRNGFRIVSEAKRMSYSGRGGVTRMLAELMA